MTHDERKKIYATLAAPFPDSCIQRTEGRVTGRGYNTTGIGYQFVVNRLNEVLGVGGFRIERKTSVRPTTTASGRPMFEAVCELKLQLGEWCDGTFVSFAEAVGDGGHTAVLEADARKGAFTSAFKKAAAFFGVGRQAYEGSLDDDHASVDIPINLVPTKRATEMLRPAQAGAPGESSSAPQPSPARRRLTAKQLAAIWKIVEARGWNKVEFKLRVREQYSVQPEFLTSDQASHLIESLNGNGHAQSGERSAPRTEERP